MGPLYDQPGKRETGLASCITQPRYTERAHFETLMRVIKRTEPHIDGTMKSLVFVQYCINLRRVG